MTEVEKQLPATTSTEVPSHPLITALEDPLNFNVKHPLQSEWTLWFDCPNKKTNHANWSRSLKEIVTVNTVEDFWGVHNNITKPTELPFGANYHLFKKGIKPMWEDPENMNGAKWHITLIHKYDDLVDDMWVNLLVAVLGESEFVPSTEVCGVVMSVRKTAMKLALWIRSHDNKEQTDLLGQRFKEALNLPASENLSIEFVTHADAAKPDKK
ncbi:translation initiation factor eIF4e [Ramicandelaber brevisporus]|nr:translation initiation factor eIF4e [Ramicandelaber brevisporus]KAI8873682.1 translation initiation factor eIF4e [Ramicandelaber brevisporus]